MGELVVPVAALAFAAIVVLVTAGLGVLTGRVVTRVRARRAVVVAGLLSGPERPYLSRPVPGTLLLSPQMLWWRPDGGGTTVDLTRSGLELLERDDEHDGAFGTRLTMRDGGGTVLDLLVAKRDVRRLTVALRDWFAPESIPEPLPPRTLRPKRRPVVTAGSLIGGLPAHLLVAGVLLMVLGAGSAASVAPVEARVISGDGFTAQCWVRWTDSDRVTRDRPLDCAAPAGAVVEIRPLPWPVHGDVVAADRPLLVAETGAGVIAVGLGLMLVRYRARRRLARPRLAPRRRGTRARDDGSDGVAGIPTPRIASAQLTWTPIAAAARTRAEHELVRSRAERDDDVAGDTLSAAGAAGPADDAAEGSDAAGGSDAAEGSDAVEDSDAVDEPGSARTAAASDRRHLARVTARAVVVLAVLGAGYLLFGTGVRAVVATATGPTGYATAQLVGAPRDPLPFAAPASQEVRFPTAEGTEITTRVAVAGVPDDPPPATLPVEYAAGDPGRAIALRHGGHVRSVVLALVLAGLLVWALLDPVLTAAAQRRRLRRTWRRGAVSDVRYVLFDAPGGNVALLVWRREGESRPDGVLTLPREQSGNIPVTGDIDLRGTLEGGQVVVPVHDKRRLVPSSRWVDIGDDELLALVNAPAAPGSDHAGDLRLDREA